MEEKITIPIAISCTGLTVNPDAISKNSGTFSYLYSKLGSSAVKNEKRFIKISQSSPFKPFERPTNLQQDPIFESEVMDDDPFLFPSQIAELNWSPNLDYKMFINIYYSSNKTDNKSIFLCGATFTMTEMTRFFKLHPGQKFEIHLTSEYCVGARAFIEILAHFPAFLDDNPFQIQAPPNNNNPYQMNYVFYNEHKGSLSENGTNIMVDAQEVVWEPRLAVKIPDLFLQNIVGSLEKSISAWRLRWDLERKRQRQFKSLEEALSCGWHEIGISILSAKITPLWVPDTTPPPPPPPPTELERTFSTATAYITVPLSGQPEPKYKPDENEPCLFVDLFVEDPQQTFALHLGRTNTEYFTYEPQFGSNLHAAYVRKPHKDPVPGSTRLQQTPKKFYYSQATPISPYEVHSSDAGEGGAVDAGKPNNLPHQHSRDSGDEKKEKEEGEEEEEQDTFDEDGHGKSHLTTITGQESCFWRYLPHTKETKINFTVLQDDSKGDGSNRLSILGTSTLDIDLLLKKVTPVVFSSIPGGMWGLEGEGDTSVWELSLPIDIDIQSEGASKFTGGEISLRITLSSPKGVQSETRPTFLSDSEDDFNRPSTPSLPLPIAIPVVSMEDVCVWQRDQQGTILANAVLNTLPNQDPSNPLTQGQEYQRILADCYDWLWLLGLSGTDPLILQNEDLVTRAPPQPNDFKPSMMKRRSQSEDWQNNPGRRSTRTTIKKDVELLKRQEIVDQLVQLLSISPSLAQSVIQKASMASQGHDGSETIGTLELDQILHFYVENPEQFLETGSNKPEQDNTLLAEFRPSAVLTRESLSSTTDPHMAPTSQSTSLVDSEFAELSRRIDPEYPLEWIKSHIQSMEELSSELLDIDGEVKEMLAEGSSHRPSGMKKEMAVQAIPINLHYHFFLMREHEVVLTSPPPPSPSPSPSLLLSPSSSTSSTISPSPSLAVSSTLSLIPPTNSTSSPSSSSPSTPTSTPMLKEKLNREGQKQISVENIVTCGSFSPHGLGYKKGGLCHQEKDLFHIKYVLNQTKAHFIRERIKAGEVAIPPTHPCFELLKDIESQVIKFEEGILSVARRRIFAISQALTVATNSLLMKLALIAEGAIPEQIAENWLEKSPSDDGAGFLILFEGLLSVNGNEQTMVEDTDTAIEALRNFQIRLLELPPSSPRQNPESPETSTFASSLPSPPPHVMIKGREVIIYLSLPALQSLPPLYLQKARSGGAIVKLYPVLMTQGIDITQTMATTFSLDTSKGLLLQHEINAKAFHLLHRYCNQVRPVHFSKDPLSMEYNLESQSLDQSEGSIKKERTISHSDNLGSSQLVHPLMQPYLSALKTVSLSTKNVDLLVEGERICLLLNGCQVTFCKSGKDRTGMAVTYQQSRQLGELFACGDTPERVLRDANHMRQYGCRLSICEKNTGRRVFAINMLQAQFLPAMYRPPAKVCEDVLKKDNS